MRQEAVQDDLGLQGDVFFRVDLRLVVDADGARMLGQHEENHGRDHGVDRVVDVDRRELAALDAALEDAAQQVMARPHHLAAVERGQLGEVVALAHHELGEARGLRGAHALPPDAHAVAQHVGGAALEGLELLVPLGEAAREVLDDHGLEELFLARKVKKERALGNTGPRRHFFGARGRKPFLDEEVERRLQELAGTRFLPTLALGADRAQLVGEKAGGGHPVERVERGSRIVND